MRKWQKKPRNFGPDFSLQNFFLGFACTRWKSYHHTQFYEKILTQTPENGEKTHFRPDLSPLGPNSGHQFFCTKWKVVSHRSKLLSYAIWRKTSEPNLRKWQCCLILVVTLDVTSYHCMQLQGKRIVQTQ